MTKQLKQVISRTRELIEQGWVQGTYTKEKDGRVCFCSMGALRAAARDISAQAMTKGLFDARLLPGALLVGALDTVKRTGAGDQRDSFSLVAWNDHKGRTQAEVVELFARAEASL